ncbi:interferon-induced very large GTPase 1-like [Mercenaria mercenaria]|uniref:interferon-induced very large GTPase 1-like n=1 Tax=Mercenaria mercenaria TaxID=6596 RepID=UPI00234E937E|nr:interferon-induced very large GTPase 1-like [Mercenaria mercenaria]
MSFHQILLKLGLTDKYPGKITLQEVTTVDINEANEVDEQSITLADIPWMMLKRLICAHAEARDIRVTDEDSMDLDTMAFISESSENSQDISPLDIFIVVFQCCDPFLKQIFFQKLYLCKIAVPFLYKSWTTKGLHQQMLSVWPLRSLAIETQVSSGDSKSKYKEADVLELTTHCLAFARFGRPRYSKSKLLNSLLSRQGCKTFFNIDCPSGMTPKCLSDGHIEMFWLPKVGGNKDQFQEPMTFLNMRGDIKGNFNVDTLNFIASFVDTVAIIIDSESILKQALEVKGVLFNFSSIILIISNPLRPVIQWIENFKSEIISSKLDISLRVISTHKGVVEQNVVDMVSCLSKCITIQMKSAKTKSYQERLSSYKASCTKYENIKTDEDDQYFQSSKHKAEKFVNQMKLESDAHHWKKAVTPVHCKYSGQLGTLMKKRERMGNLDEVNKIDCTMKTIRQHQIRAISKPIKQFLDILTRESHGELKILLCWLHFYIEREKRLIMHHLKQESCCAWENLKTLKSAEILIPSDIKRQENLINDLEMKLDEASFSVEHLFRETGHIYDAVLTLNENASKIGLPPTDEIANITGHLVADGHQLELIDGESFYMPYKWTSTVLRYVNEYIGSSKVMTLSVLGIQSSGKSTLLNTMFGSQFSTRTGRCTRGIHVQLIPLKPASFTGITSPFNYILIVDTEGLRSPELSHTHHEHDNELATVITGLGDVTMLNIMGENPGEIRDILQIIVHAFLRLKMTNRNLDIRKCCTFIHQNVQDSSASENMMSGLNTLMKKLDEMTRESARSENILDITSFNQVIEFDIKSQVWYLKNLWQGNPPKAPVNTEYSERVVEIKCKVLYKALTMKNKSYKALTDIIDHAHSLWKGVLSEDFVFSFRNSLEIRVYMEMAKVVQDQLWHLESFIHKKLNAISQSKFAGCDQEFNVRSVAEKLIIDLNGVLAEEKSKTEIIIAAYFEDNEYKDITVQWKESQQRQIDSCCLELEQRIREEIEKRRVKRSVEILTVASREIHEEELRKMSMAVANKHRGMQLSTNKITQLFGNIWMSFINKISYTTEKNRKNMKDIFENCLKNDLFKQKHILLNESLKRSSCLTPLPSLKKLEGSFKLTGINDTDISFKWPQKLIEFGKELLGIKNTIMKNVAENVNQIFATADDKIKQFRQVKDEITEMSVNKLMHELDTSIRAILTGKSDYDFKITFYIKFHVHVSRYAHLVFEKHNDEYFEIHGIAARLEQYRQQQEISFRSHITNRQSEDIVANLFSHVIEGFADAWTSQNLPNKVSDELYSKLPSVKNMVIIEICSELLDKGSFNHFVRYIQTPKEYVRLWINENANKLLFSQASPAYARIAHALLDSVFNSVETCLHGLKTSFTGKPSPSMEMWIHDFHMSLKDANLSIPQEDFRNVKLELEQIENVEYLTNKILEYMDASRKNLCAKYKDHSSDSVEWSDTNPIERITKKIWGCPEQCAFCGEPCAKNVDHSDSVHYSIQHRPSCCNGTRDKDTAIAFFGACGFYIQSNYTHNCPAFNYSCNKETRNDCIERHHYRDYKNFLPEWDIPPSSNMHDTSKFWMWFVATFKKDLHNYYDYKVENVPSSWDEITKEQAKESLLNTYSVRK